MANIETSTERTRQRPLTARAGAVASTASDRGSDVATEAAGQARSAIETARDRSRDVADEAVGRARDVVGTVRQEGSQVAEEVADRAKALASEAKGQLDAQTEEGVRRLAQGVDRLAAQAIALAQGRPDEAAPLSDLVWEAAERLTWAADGLHDLADTFDQKGWEGAAAEIQSFARRRPAALLLGATIAGFGLGRGIRSSSAPPPAVEDPRQRPGPALRPSTRYPELSSGAGRGNSSAQYSGRISGGRPRPLRAGGR